MPIKSFLVDIDLNKNQLLNAKLQNLATPPAVVSGDTGVFYWSTSDKTAYFWTGTIWKSLESYSYVHPNHFGDVVSNSDSGTTIQVNVVTNAKLAQMTNNTIKGRFSAGTGDPEDLSINSVRTMLGIANIENVSLSTWSGSTSITTLGTITGGTWQATIISPTYGGTGVNNANKTITLGGNLTTTGSFATTLNVTGNTNITLPMTGTLSTLAGNENLTNKTITASGNTITGLTNDNLSGTAGISNANIANPYVTIGSTTFNLGSTGTTITGLSSVTSTTFIGALTGNASSASYSSNSTIVDDITNATMYPVWVTANSGNLPIKVTSGKLYFNPSTGALSAASLIRIGGLSTEFLKADGSVDSNTYATTTDAVLKTDYNLPYAVLATQVSGNTPTQVLLGTNSVLGRINGSIQAIAIDSDLDVTSLNDDTLASAKAIKYYIDLVVTGALVYQGGYDAATNTPMLDITPMAGIRKGWTFTVTTNGTFFSIPVQIGDMVIAEVNSPVAEDDWTIVNKNIPDIVSATTTSEGILYLATNLDVATATSTTKAITPSSLSSINLLGTITGGTWQASVINSTYGGTGVNNGGRTLTIGNNSGTINYTTASTILTVADNASVSGTNTGDQTTITGNAGSASTIAITNDTTTNANMFPTWVTGNTGNQSVGVTSSKIYFNPSTGLLTSTLYAGTWNGNIITGLYGGTGVNNNGKTITLGGNLTTAGAFNTTINVTNTTNVTLPTGGTLTAKYGVDITGNGILTTFVITHNLATTDIVTFVKEVTTSAKVEVEEIVSDANTLTINFNTPPAIGKVFRVVVVG